MVKLLVFIGVIIGLLDIAPTESTSAMLTDDTAESSSDTGPEGADSGNADTGVDPNRDDTGSATHDSGMADTGGVVDANSAPKYSAAELAGEKGGCSTAPMPLSTGWAVAFIALVFANRRR